MAFIGGRKGGYASGLVRSDCSCCPPLEPFRGIRSVGVWFSAGSGPSKSVVSGWVWDFKEACWTCSVGLLKLEAPPTLLDCGKLGSTFGKLLVNGDCIRDEDAEAVIGEETLVLTEDLVVEAATLDFALAIDP